ncbi:MAG: M3 family oligoendopeptidase [Anaerolineales bacterium]|nr:M3 family oligoendopeptidase [Anaerolineales bacterium]
MFSKLPNTTHDFMEYSRSQIEPYFQELIEFHLNSTNLEEWLSQWTGVYFLIIETQNRLRVQTSKNTTDRGAELRYQKYLDEIFPQFQIADQKLKDKLLSAGLEPDRFEIPLRKMRSEADLYREENVPLLSEELKLSKEYDKIIGAQTTTWEGEEISITQLRPVYQDRDRERRQKAWQLAAERQLADREAINSLWRRFMELRAKLAANAGFDNYRDYRWMNLARFDYSPPDCRQFHQAIEEVVVPAALRIYENRRDSLDVRKLRPWDLEVDPLGRPQLLPFKDEDDLKSTAAGIFRMVDAQFGKHFDTMRREDLLDLENRKGKAPGGYCTVFPVSRRPFIFMNAVGLHDDVQTLLHEAGHAFHVFEKLHLPYHQQMNSPMEFNEVASMSMELLAAPYLETDAGGFYTPEEAARARIEHLEKIVLFWPYMAVVDAFQHWVYENHETATDPSNCDAVWAELWQRFMPGVDWSGFEQEMMTGWQRKLHIHKYPFYYVEYGFAQIGAVQVWKNALKDQPNSIRQYRQGISLGGTATLPELFAAAGARFAFDSAFMKDLVDIIESDIASMRV